LWWPIPWWPIKKYGFVPHGTCRFFFFVAVGWEAFKNRFELKTWMNKTWQFLLGVNVIVLIFRILIPAKEMAAYNKFLWDWHIDHHPPLRYIL
jgi:hypothetical protein